MTVFYISLISYCITAFISLIIYRFNLEVVDWNNLDLNKEIKNIKGSLAVKLSLIQFIFLVLVLLYALVISKLL